MGYNLRITNSAESDVLNAIDYYDLIHPMLGTRFIRNLYNTYDRIKTNPELYSFISSEKPSRYRDIKVTSFPYVVIYEMSKKEIIVIAVLNTHRKPLAF